MTWPTTTSSCRRPAGSRSSCGAEGGSTTPSSLRRTAVVLEQGAAGIVYGRNVIQHADPAGLTRALMAMLHDGASVDAAAAMVGAR